MSQNTSQVAIGEPIGPLLPMIHLFSDLNFLPHDYLCETIGRSCSLPGPIPVSYLPIANGL